MGRIGMLGLCSFGSPYSLGGCGTLQFVVMFALQCGCRVSLKYLVGLFVVNKRVNFVVVVCLVHNNSHPSLVCRQDDFVLVCFQSFRCILFGNEADCKVEVTLLLMLSLVDSDSSCWRDRTASTLATIASVGICLGVTECFLLPMVLRCSRFARARAPLLPKSVKLHVLSDIKVLPHECKSTDTK